MKDEFKTYISEAIQGAMSTVIAKFNSGIREGSPHMVTTPRSEFASNSVHCPCCLTNNLDNVFTLSLVARPTLSDKSSVILVDSQNKELAKGYIVTDSTVEMNHGRKVGIGEKKVHINEVLEPDAPLWFFQGRNQTFSAYVSRGYMIWVEPWLKYI